MKRSKINAEIKYMEEIMRKHGFEVPPFCKWSPADWESRGREYDEIRDNKLGWDVTDYGLGDFDKVGFTLITIRNGNVKMGRYTKVYAEKLLLIKRGQTSPQHFHWNKMEDIINRGGGNVLITLYNSGEDGRMEESEVTVDQDGRCYQVPAGSEIRLAPGESLTLRPYLYHGIRLEEGSEYALLGEVSMCNDDDNDNRFYEPVARFPKIEEDETPYRLLCTEYPGTRNVLIMADAGREYFEQAKQLLRENGIRYSFGDPLDVGEEALIRQAANSIAVVAGSEQWTRKVLENCRKMKAIVRCGTGYDGIDVNAAKELGIQVANTPGINVYAVAEMALSMILCLQRKLKMYDHGIRQGEWGPLHVRELRGKKVGLIGFGGIARQLARLLAPFDCCLKAYDVCWDEAAAEKLGVEFGQLEEIYRTSDIISLHLPLLPATRHMICKETLKMMKPECILVNTSRGGIVNTEDLCDALKDHVIAGAGLDVHEMEPVPADYRPFLEPRLILSPHVASATEEATAAMILASVNEVIRFYESGTLMNPVY